MKRHAIVCLSLLVLAIVLFAFASSAEAAPPPPVKLKQFVLMSETPQGMPSSPHLEEEDMEATSPETRELARVGEPAPMTPQLDVILDSPLSERPSTLADAAARRLILNEELRQPGQEPSALVALGLEQCQLAEDIANILAAQGDAERSSVVRADATRCYEGIFGRAPR